MMHAQYSEYLELTWPVSAVMSKHKSTQKIGSVTI